MRISDRDTAINLHADKDYKVTKPHQISRKMEMMHHADNFNKRVNRKILSREKKSVRSKRSEFCRITSRNLYSSNFQFSMQDDNLIEHHVIHSHKFYSMAKPAC